MRNLRILRIILKKNLVVVYFKTESNKISNYCCSVSFSIPRNEVIYVEKKVDNTDDDSTADQFR